MTVVRYSEDMPLRGRILRRFKPQFEQSIIYIYTNKIQLWEVQFKGDPYAVEAELRNRGFSPAVLERCGPIGHLYFLIWPGTEGKLEGIKESVENIITVGHVVTGHLGDVGCVIEKIY